MRQAGDRTAEELCRARLKKKNVCLFCQQLFQSKFWRWKVAPQITFAVVVGSLMVPVWKL